MEYVLELEPQDLQFRSVGVREREELKKFCGLNNWLTSGIFYQHEKSDKRAGWVESTRREGKSHVLMWMYVFGIPIRLPREKRSQVRC